MRRCFAMMIAALTLAGGNIPLVMACGECPATERKSGIEPAACCCEAANEAPACRTMCCETTAPSRDLPPVSSRTGTPRLQSLCLSALSDPGAFPGPGFGAVHGDRTPPVATVAVATLQVQGIRLQV